MVGTSNLGSWNGHWSNPPILVAPEFPGSIQFLRSPRYPIDAGEEHLVPRLHADHAGQLRQGLDRGML